MFVLVVFEIHAGFDGGAAAETPGSVEDFCGQGLFDCAYRDEICLVGVAEFGVNVLFVGADEVSAGKKARGQGVSRDFRFAFGRDRAG